MSQKKNNTFSVDSSINKKIINSLDSTISNEYECLSCGGFDMTEDSSQGLLTCTDCGLVSGGVYFNGPDKINYDDGEKNESRFSMPVNTLLPESSIGYSNIVGHGCSKMREIQKWGIPYKERSLKLIYSELEQICYKNKILKTIEDDAKILFKKISECIHQTGKNKGKNMIHRGNKRKGIIAACLYNAYKKNKLSKMPKQIAKMFGITITEMNSGCRKFDEMIDANNFTNICDTSVTHKPYYYIKQVCDNENFSMDEKHIDNAIEISKNIEKLDLITTHTPHSIAVVSVMLMAEYNNLNGLTKKKIASLFEITDVTLNKIYKKIENYKDIVTNTKKTSELMNEINKNKNNIEIPKEIYQRMKIFGISTDVIPINNNNYFQVRYQLDTLLSSIYDSHNIDISVLSKLKYLREIQNANIRKN